MDIEDCCTGAQSLADQGKADAGKLVIDGGSAGGFAALAALTFHKVFSAGTSFYGICDLVALTKDTHKFESRYTDTLIGPYPEDEEVYEARSPINHVDQLDCALCIFQGSEDKVRISRGISSLEEQEPGELLWNFGWGYSDLPLRAYTLVVWSHRSSVV